MSDDDVQALVAYMNTLTAIRNPLPQTKLDFPVNYLVVSSPAPGRNIAAVDTADKLSWGLYLVMIAGCGRCHTPMEKGERLHGTMREAEFIERFHQYREYARDGVPIMPWMAYSKMSSEELSAIYAYLRTVAPVNHSVETHP